MLSFMPYPLVCVRVCAYVYQVVGSSAATSAPALTLLGGSTSAGSSTGGDVNILCVAVCTFAGPLLGQVRCNLVIVLW